MNTAFRPSFLRACVGGGLLLLGLLIGLFALPSARSNRDREKVAKDKAEKELTQQRHALGEYQKVWNRYRSSREVVEALERQLAGDFTPDKAAELPDAKAEPEPDAKAKPGSQGPRPPKGVGELQWMLSRRLYDLAQKHGVRIASVKYGVPNREGTKGTDLEALDVEFASLGVYTSLKPFMLALEGSELPFAVVTARLEESPEGARLSAVLRAFRKSSTPASTGRTGEES